MLNRLCIIGVGLIGGSLARAAKQRHLCHEVVGGGRDPAQLQRAQDLGVIDRGSCNPAQIVQGADVVVLAIPLGAMEDVLRDIKPYLGPGTVITDVGSAKACVVAAAQTVFGVVPPGFVPGHPIAGIEKSGVEHSFAELFQGRRVILTPVAHTSKEAVNIVRELWEAVGAEVLEMEVVRHDAILAATSHLPHLLAYALVDSLVHMHEHTDIFRYAASGFRDFTRIASSDPVMWRDICLANGAAILTVLDQYNKDLSRLYAAIQQQNGPRLLEIFSSAKAARDIYVAEK